MPQPGQCWRHVVIGTLGSWLPGDPRGWRSRGHKLHSSGDYRDPPPNQEHRGLYRYSKTQRPSAVVIPHALRPVVGVAFRKYLSGLGHRVLAVAVGGVHAHILAELPAELWEARAVVGQAKRASSRAVRSELPGRVWAGGGRFKAIDSPTYQRRVYRYILGHYAEGAWVWSERTSCA
jgi:hypothetical protein